MIIYFLKFVTFFLRTFTKSSGTALPGLWLEQYFPRTAKKLLSNFDKVILVTGTNGKTTTSQMICRLLARNGIDFVTNKSGSNLVRGILSSVLEAVELSRPTSPRLRGIGIFEVEEGSMPKLTKLLKADCIVVTNIFRDQLDAYGEIDKTTKYIREAILNSDNPKLILNGDELRVLNLEKSSSNKKLIVHLDEKYLKQIKIEKISNYKLQITNENYLQVLIDKIKINEDLSSDFTYSISSNNFFGNTKVPGLHNVINAVYAQVLVREVFGEKLDLDLSGFEPAFGRGEIISVIPVSEGIPGSRQIIDSRDPGISSTNVSENRDDTFRLQFQILLAKNPAGLNLNFHLLENTKNREAVLLILNDKIADGRDVSWIWDADFSILKNLGFKNIFIAGTRRFDMALRFNYELGIANYKLNDVGVIATQSEAKGKQSKDLNSEIASSPTSLKLRGIPRNDKPTIFDSIPQAVTTLLQKDFEKVYVLPTYTAMREFRDELSKYTNVKRMYE